MRMVETGGAVKCFPVGWNVPAKSCDTCKNAVALLYCRKDTAYLCLACDVKIHSHTRHERVWMCEVSSSSIDAGIVPEGNSMSEISHPFALHANNNSDLSASQAPTQLSGSDREARVMRYREKRKNRKFEKTIRYASRKAYAETRPRIKGRFAKRTDSEPDADRWLFTTTSSVGSKNSYGLEVEYGVVPSYSRGL
ncbi:CONSTANS-like 5 [Artemisia annua]|uniref:CONSTANS-like 5 n=1 Tax=Artemisia annua TaxID=35608 RepID=A0A2U1LRL6_ARTAN|nr:CONSTANS-like 5 [Artemisia annua]